MSDFLKKVKSLFIVEEETPQTAAPEKAAETPAPAPAPAPSASIPGTGSVTDKFLEILLGALEKNNQPGFDYLEFRQALQNLSKMPMDEATRFQSAFAMAQTMGVTPATLQESARFYLSVLDQEQAKFNEAHQQQRARLIGNREEELKKLDGQIRQKTEQIHALTQEIEAHKARIEQVSAEINESTLKIEGTKADFEATFVSVQKQIQQDLGKMQEHLKA